MDTTFAVVDMGARAVDQLRREGVPAHDIVRRTVPGFKDLGAACRQLLDGADARGRAADAQPCDIAIACAMVGAEPIDKQCAQDASFGLQLCQQATAKHVLEVFVHMDECAAEELVAVTDNRVREHVTNAFWLVEAPDELTRRAGTGQRQGFADIGSIERVPVATRTHRPGKRGKRMADL